MQSNICQSDKSVLVKEKNLEVDFSWINFRIYAYI